MDARTYEVAEAFFNKNFDNVKREAKKYNVKISFNNFKQLTLSSIENLVRIDLDGEYHFMPEYTLLELIFSNLGALADESVRLGLCNERTDFFYMTYSTIKSNSMLKAGTKFLLESLLSDPNSTMQPIIALDGRQYNTNLFIAGILRSSPKLKESVLIIPTNTGISVMDDLTSVSALTPNRASKDSWSCAVSSATLGGLKSKVTLDNPPTILRAFIRIDMEGDMAKGYIRVDIPNHPSVEMRSNLVGDQSTLATFLLWRVLSRLTDDVAGYLNVKSNVELGTSRSAHFMLNALKAKFPINEFSVRDINLPKQKDSKSIYVKPEYSVSQKDVALLTSVSLNFGTAIISTHAHLRYIERRIRVDGRFDPLSYNNFKQFLISNTWDTVSDEDCKNWDLSESEGQSAHKPDVKLFSTPDSAYVIAVDTVHNYIVTVLVKGYSDTYNDQF